MEGCVGNAPERRVSARSGGGRHRPPVESKSVRKRFVNRWMSSDYDRNKGGIQELHHKIESKILQYWGEDSGILIGITPIYKRRLWSKEVNVINDKQ